METQMLPMVEMLENRELLTTVFFEGFEGAFPGANWTVTASQGRTWEDVNIRAHTGSWSGYGSYLNTTSWTYENNMNSYFERTVNLGAYAGRQIVLDFHFLTNMEEAFDDLQVFVNGSSRWARTGVHKKWQKGFVSLSSYAGNASVTIRFAFRSDDSVVPKGIAGAFLDDIRLTVAPAAYTSISDSFGTMVKEKHTQTGTVFAGMPRHVYQFTLPYEKKFTAKLKMTGGDADLYLCDSTGAVLLQSTWAGTKSESISTTLAAGTYYLRVDRLDGTVDYSLTAK